MNIYEKKFKDFINEEGIKNDMLNENFIQRLELAFTKLSPEARKALRSSLVQSAGKAVCKGYDGDCEASVATGNETLDIIDRNIAEMILDGNPEILGDTVDWRRINGTNSDYNSQKEAIKILMEISNWVYDETGDTDFAKLFLKQLNGGNSHLLRNIGLKNIKYKSINPGVASYGRGAQTGYMLEHIVPTSYFISELIRMIQQGYTDQEFDNVLDKYYGVMLNTDDAKKVDSTPTANGTLRTNMPDGWTWNDDPLDRYIAADIDLDTLEPM